MFSSKIQMLVASAVLFSAPALQAEISPVSVRVEVVGKSDNDKNKKIAHKSLKVFVSNSSAEAMELTVKNVIFGRDAKSKDIVALGEGENPVSVKPRSMATVETASVTAEMEEAHRDKKTKVDASGTKYTGYGLQVFAGEKMVAELYEPASLKESWGKVAPASNAAKTATKKK